MAIHVICPGCLARFEVSDRFAGKRGPCPKCGHIIEIPKENIVVHAPDEIMVEGKKTVNPDLIRPIEQKTVPFVQTALLVNLVVAIAVLVIALVFHFIPTGPVTWVVGGLLLFVVAFPLVKYGYMMVRDPNDLEIFLGGELTRKSAIAMVGFAFLWIVFEGILLFLNPGTWGVLYLIPVVLLAAFIPLVLFDMEYGNGLMLFAVFVIAIIILRGLMIHPDGWIWDYRYDDSRPLPAVTAPASDATTATPDAQSSNGGGDAEAGEEGNDGGNGGESTPAKPVPRAPRLNKNAPDPTSRLKRK